MNHSLLTIHSNYMHRCLELAEKGAGHVAPNPMVGAVLVHKEKIIGEGYHREYGQAHAEVNCIASVAEEDKKLIAESTLYVSLEPCAHFGKTPPCTDLIIKNKIPKVVIGCRDPFKEVNGKGIEKLKAAGVDVTLGILEDECRELNKRFFTFYTKHRPYIILKWAQTGDGFIAASFPAQENADNGRLLISNEYTNRLVHRWRSEEASILVGTNTALRDDPSLTNRLWEGPSPVRMVIDMDMKLPASLHIYDRKVRTIVFNKLRHEERKNLYCYQVTEDVSLVQQVINALYQLKIQSVLVEGGARLLQSFIDEGMWDEIRKIENGKLKVENGLPGPKWDNGIKVNSYEIAGDTVEIFKQTGT